MSELRTVNRTRDVLVVLGVFLALGVVGAFVWDQVAALPEFTRVKGNATMDEYQLGRQISADGWYALIALVGGLVAGVVLMLRRGADALVTMIVIGLSAALGAFVMLKLGLLLGPPDPASVLKETPVGAKVPARLELHAHGLLLVWPMAALLGAVSVIFLTTPAEAASEPAEVL